MRWNLSKSQSVHHALLGGARGDGRWPAAVRIESTALGQLDEALVTVQVLLGGVRGAGRHGQPAVDVQAGARAAQAHARDGGRQLRDEEGKVKMAAQFCTSIRAPHESPPLR